LAPTTIIATGLFTTNGSTVSIGKQINTPATHVTATFNASTRTLAWPAQPGSSPRLTIIETYAHQQYFAVPTYSNGYYYYTFPSAPAAGLSTESYYYNLEFLAGSDVVAQDTGVVQINRYTVPASVSPTSAGTAVTSISGFTQDVTNPNVLRWSSPNSTGVNVEVRYKNPPTSGAWTSTRILPAGTMTFDFAGVSGAVSYEVRYVTSAGIVTAARSGNLTITRTTLIGGTATDTTAAVAPVPPQVAVHIQEVDRWGNVRRVLDPLLNETYYRYNQFDQLVETILPTSTVVSTAGNHDLTSTINVHTYNYYDVFGQLVATRDGNDNVNRMSYNAGGQEILEIHADDAVLLGHSRKSFVYNAFGEQILITDEGDYDTRKSYDRVGRLTDVARELTDGALSAAGGNWIPSLTASNVIVVHYGYDNAGRRISETSGEVMDDGVTPETTRYWYDERGNVIKRRLPRYTEYAKRETDYEYDATGNKTREIDGLGLTEMGPYAQDIGGVLSWTYDYFGRLQSKTDVSGVGITTYHYDNLAGLLTSQASNLGENIAYKYDASGHLIEMNDTGVGRVTKYGYDLAGRRTNEWVTVTGQSGQKLTFQNLTINYDSLNRIWKLHDRQYSLEYSYDGANNRTHTAVTYFDYDHLSASQDLWFTYDAMNRVVISQGVRNSATGMIEATGATSSEQHYNSRGLLESEYSAGSWQVNFAPYPYYFFNSVESTDFGLKKYFYDGLGRLTETKTQQLFAGYPITDDNPDGLAPYISETRSYDKASRIRQINGHRSFSKWAGLFTTDPNSAPQNGYQIVAAPFVTTYDYDDDGRIRWQETTSTNGSGVARKGSRVDYGDSQRSWVQQPNGPVPGDMVWGPGFDEAGNLRGYVVTVYKGFDNYGSPISYYDEVAYTTNHRLVYELRDTYREVAHQTYSGQNGPGFAWTATSYNVNNEIVQIQDQQGPDYKKYRYFVSDASGQTISSVAGNFNTSAAIDDAFKKAVIGGSAPASYRPSNYFFANGNAVGSVALGKPNFDVNRSSVADQTEAATPGNYVVVKGDTLRVIAQRVYGDANLWYLLADASGYGDPDAPLQPGTTISIPNRVVSLSNDANTFKPFNAGDVIGDTSPTPPPPMQSGGHNCGVIGQIVTAIIVIVLSIIAPELGMVWYQALVYAFASGIIASAVGQLVNVAIGAQKTVDGKQMLIAGITSALTMGASQVIPVSAIGNAFVRGAVTGAMNNAISQGVNISFHLQDKFEWRSVAVAAAAGGASEYVSEKVGLKLEKAGKTPKEIKVGSNAAGTVASAGVRLALNGKTEVVGILADVFGNLIGNSLKSQMTLTSAAREDREAFLRGYNSRNGSRSIGQSEYQFGMPAQEIELDNNLAEPTVISFTRDEQRREVAGIQQSDVSTPDSDISGNMFTGYKTLNEFRRANPPTFAQQALYGSGTGVSAYELDAGIYLRGDVIENGITEEQFNYSATRIGRDESAYRPYDAADAAEQALRNATMKQWLYGGSPMGPGIAETAAFEIASRHKEWTPGQAVAAMQMFQAADGVGMSVGGAYAGGLAFSGSQNRLQEYSDFVGTAAESALGARLNARYVPEQTNTGLGGVVPRVDTGVTWGRGIQGQGIPFESYNVSQSPYVDVIDLNLIKTNFKAFDQFVPSVGEAISNKTLNTRDPSYQKHGAISRKINDYVKDMVNFKGDGGNGFRLDPSMIQTRTMQLSVPATTNTVQWAEISREVSSAQAKGVKVVVTQLHH
jgi:YD repeat-containing protein